jgi:hypothetical protein
MLLEHGITVTALGLRMLIEAAVGEFNQVFAAKPLQEITTGVLCDKGPTGWTGKGTSDDYGNPGPDEPGEPGPAGMPGQYIVDVQQLTDDQLRELIQSLGHAVPASFTREDMETALDEAAAQANT